MSCTDMIVNRLKLMKITPQKIALFSLAACLSILPLSQSASAITDSLLANRKTQIEQATVGPNLKARELTKSESAKAVRAISYAIDVLDSSGRSLSRKKARIAGLSPYQNKVIINELSSLSPREKVEVKKYFKVLEGEARKGRWRPGQWLCKKKPSVCKKIHNALCMLVSVFGPPCSWASRLKLISLMIGSCLARAFYLLMPFCLFWVGRLILENWFSLI